ncbi:hypothetical protein BJ875DRAFT_223578 [Amylocarpus encephaloides]|uniref:Protein SQS1 n=1 Tax=Amylocarpus encephaloides TaxID=45428 RepID=A0A9P8BZS9_9HELO|nr:hypothetical protein BJ875DRAFT_223578 [Amylocarpus encephaloides]
MPRSKKAARRGNFSKASRGNVFVPFNGASSTPLRMHHGAGFTLQQEANNTGRHSASGNTDRRLRDVKVNFVSAGNLHNEEAAESESMKAETALAHMTLEPPMLDPQARKRESRDIAHKANYSPLEPEVPLPFIIDTCGSQIVSPSLPAPNIRPVSPTPSDSSEEVILFRGRGRQPRTFSDRPRKAAVNANDSTVDKKIKIIEGKLREKEELLEAARYRNNFQQDSRNVTQPDLQRLPLVDDSRDDSKSGPREGQRSRRQQRKRNFQQSTKQQNDEDALFADYIANIDAEESLGEASGTLQSRELGGAEYGIYQEEQASFSSEAFLTDAPHDHTPNEWDASDLQDFEESSTSDTGLDAFGAILSKRNSKSGTQYLVVFENQSVDARWVEESNFTSADARRLMSDYETSAKLVAEAMKDVDGPTDSAGVNGSLEDDDEEDEDNDDDADLSRIRLDRMSDEHIARLLAKQEELGMGSDQLVLLDHEVDNKSDEYEGFSTFQQSSFNSTMAKRSKRSGARCPRGVFPAAHALVDGYDGFDVLDFDRPSLKKKPKGRKGKLQYDISDSELENDMQNAWENDRLKKKERKQQREELRAQGLLGSDNKKPNLQGKYKEGMRMYAVKEEIKEFLMRTDTTLALPPMNKLDRKIVHELGNIFNLKTKSVGQGNDRRPILYRIARTPRVYVEGTFEVADARLCRRFLPRMDPGSKKSGASRLGRGGDTGTRYRDGDVVGASAPELGAENKGRAMLEKMGWSTGTALGALNNKGILQPVTHVVKTSKAGLG